MVPPDRDVATPTPTPRRVQAATTFEIGAGSREDSEDEDAATSATVGSRAPWDEGSPLPDMDVTGVTLDDDDFESHYSRQESSESEDGTEEGEGEGEEQRQERNQNGTVGPGGHPPVAPERPDALSRVRSLPARPLLPQTGSVHSHPQQQVGGLHTSQSTTSLPPVIPPPLYPPFYNRPPTPLPPSPTLTSLLRPPSLLNRSTASTRPTTPDSSDLETPNDTEAAVAHSARRANPPPPTSPKVPTYEYYGFVLYLASTLAFLIYILWSYLPSAFLHAVGITYYPNRWWSLAIPAWIVMLLIFIYVALLSYNVEHLTLPLASLECMVDDAANVAILDDFGRLRKGGSKRFIQDLQERAKLEREMIKSGKARKNWKGSIHRSKDKGKRRSSKAPSAFQAAPAEVFPRDNQRSYSPLSAPSNYRYHDAATYPFISPTVQSNQAQRGHPTQGSYTSYPNWNLVWNEGTDAVMDIPIGGVCEVLYG